MYSGYGAWGTVVRGSATMDFNVVFKTGELKELKAFVFAMEMGPSMQKIWELQEEIKKLQGQIEELEVEKSTLDGDVEALKEKKRR